MTNVEELQRALDFPWEKWTVFLHPEQRQWVERDYTGPARVSGSAGTGKTIVALHRAVHLARTHPDARVLLTTFSDTLANALQTKLKRLVEQRAAPGRTDRRLFAQRASACGSTRPRGAVKLASCDDMRELLHARHRRPSAATSSACIPAHRVGTGGGCLAVGNLGGVSRRGPPRPKDAAARGAAGGACGPSSSACGRAEGTRA